MGYREEKKRIIDYVTENGKIIELTPNKDNLKKYYQELVGYSDVLKLAIRYPGYKTSKTRCDYCVYFIDESGEHPISHVEVMRDLYDKTNSENYQQMKKYIESVAIYGKDVEVPNTLISTFQSGFPLVILTDLMFYIGLQEDINYPMPRYMGRTMCFFRYLEAIYCKVNAAHKLEEAIERATQKGGPPAREWTGVGDLYEVVSKIRYNL